MRKIKVLSPWLISYANHEASVRLFCFPYAGGSATIFRTWADYLPENIEVCAIQLPGRGSRIRETAHTSMPDLIADLQQNILPFVDEKPCVFYGHSMGSIIAFELARQLRHENIEKFIVSGHRAPHLSNKSKELYRLPKDEFLAEIKNLGGMQKEILQSVELMNLLIPVIRADFTICDTYKYEESSPLSMEITALGGMDDPRASREEIELWQKHTSSGFHFHMLPGGHFFIHSHETIFFDVLMRELAVIL